MSVNPILKAAFRDGNWHDTLCQQLWSIAEQQPSAANLKLALDASHCIHGVDNSSVERVDELIKDRRLTSWSLFFRLCSFEIEANRTDRLEHRISQHAATRLGFRQRRALVKFPRVLDYLNKHHRHLFDHKLFMTAEKAHGLLARSVTIDRLLDELGTLDTSKRVALVGNGPSIEGSSSATNIDDHDIVVRFNNTGISAEFDPDIGSKTHLWVVSPGMNLTNIVPVSPQCVVTGPEPWTRASRYWERFALQAVTQIATFDVNQWYWLVKKLSAPPSAGLLMIDALRKAGVDAGRMTTFGFSRLDGLSSMDELPKDESANHYRDDTTRSERHNWSQEANLYRQWRGS